MLEAAVDAFCADAVDALSAAETLVALARLEVVQRRLGAAGLGLVPRVITQASPVGLVHHARTVLPVGAASLR
ncbi:hypothetical protein BKG85_11760 [Mycobacteroides chelonae]|nr:hypothetical protein BKG85_11760 [Mycobacteroides chelonae]